MKLLLGGAWVMIFGAIATLFAEPAATAFIVGCSLVLGAVVYKKSLHD